MLWYYITDFVSVSKEEKGNMKGNGPGGSLGNVKDFIIEQMGLSASDWDRLEDIDTRREHDGERGIGWTVHKTSLSVRWRML